MSTAGEEFLNQRGAGYGLSLTGLVLLGVVDFLFVLPAGAFFVMGSDPCSGEELPGEPLICTVAGQSLAVGLPWGGAALGLVIGLFGALWRRGRYTLATTSLSWALTIAGVAAGLRIAMGAAS